MSLRAVRLMREQLMDDLLLYQKWYEKDPKHYKHALPGLKDHAEGIAFCIGLLTDQDPMDILQEARSKLPAKTAKKAHKRTVTRTAQPKRKMTRRGR